MAASNDSSPTPRIDMSANDINEKASERRQEEPSAYNIVPASLKDIENLPVVDHAAEARLIRKLDLYIIPPTMLLYLFSFLDRVNVGNARLYGLEEDLGLHGSQFQTAVSLLFVTYVLAETPSNLVLKKFRPSRWIAFITISWGIIATLTGLVQSYAGLIVCRLLLGAVEAGLFPGTRVPLVRCSLCHPEI